MREEVVSLQNRCVKLNQLRRILVLLRYNVRGPGQLLDRFPVSPPPEHKNRQVNPAGF